MAFFVYVSMSLILVGVTAKQTRCPCKDHRLCSPLKTPPRQEIYFWSTNTANWPHYDWDKITTVCIFGEWDPEMLCHAHSKNVRVTLKGDIDIMKLKDASYREKWIQDNALKAKRLFADGINLDVEQPVAKNSEEARLLTLLTKETADVFHKVIPGSQVTFDVAWSPKCIDKRCYDYKGIADVSDFIMVMSYDERSQIHGPCIAGPNSAFTVTFKGIQQYLALGIPAKKIVLGLPWYGYNYPCISLKGETCEIKKVPFRGVNCSDAAGEQFCYSSIMKTYVNKAISGVHFDSKSLTPYFTYKEQDGNYHQFWFDNPKSLTLKYFHGIKKLGMRGLAFWNIDCLDYSDEPRARKQTKEMWDAIFVH